MHKPLFHSSRPARQQGVVLVVALVMLLLITIVGMSAIQTLTLEERMTSNSIDRNTVFQSSEWGLSLAEQIAEREAINCNSGFVNQGAPVVVTPSPVVPAGTCVPTTCQNGLCGYPQPNCPPRWEDPAFTGWTTIKDPADASKDLATPAGAAPQFFIEYLRDAVPTCTGQPGDGPFSYRVTVRTAPGEGRASVTLQSIYGD